MRFSSILSFGGLAIQSVSGLPGTLEKRVNVDQWIQQELPIARAQLLCNIGPNGCNSAGVASGLVIASPSKSDPDCMSQKTCPEDKMRQTDSSP